MPSSGSLRILVVDDHLIFRVGLIESIHTEPGLRVVAEASTGEQALALYREHRPEVTMMDLRLPAMNGVETTAAIRREFPEARIVVLTTFEGHEDIYRALRAGASGYLLKTVSREELVDAIRTVHSGRDYLPPEVAARLADRKAKPDLSKREMEILQLIVAGKSNKEIASALFIAEVTVKVHIKHLFQKIHVADRTQAVTAAIQSGLVHLE